MKRSLALILFLLALAGGVVAPEAAFAETENSINLGFGGRPPLMKHCRADVYIAEYERLVTPRLSFLVRGAEVVYKFDDGEYVEQGKPRGMDVGARFYPSGGMKGFYVGGTLGYWRANWMFKHNKDQPNETLANGDNESIRAHIDIGGRFPIGSSSFSIMPALNVGAFFPSTSCEYISPPSMVGAVCNQETEVKAYVFLALTAGIGF